MLSHGWLMLGRHRCRCSLRGWRVLRMFWKHRLTPVRKLLGFDRRWGSRRRLGLAQQVRARHHRRHCDRPHYCCRLRGHCGGGMRRIQCCGRNYLGHCCHCRRSKTGTRGYGLGLRRMPSRNHLRRNRDRCRCGRCCPSLGSC